MTRTHSFSTPFLFAASLVLVFAMSSCEKDPIQQDLINQVTMNSKPDGFELEGESTELPALPQTKPDGFLSEGKDQIGEDPQSKPIGYTSAEQDEVGEDPMTKVNGYSSPLKQNTNGDPDLKPDGYEEQEKDQKDLSDI